MTTLAANGTTATPVFSKVLLDPNLTADQKADIQNSDIVVNAYGIQTDNLSSSVPSDIFALF